MPAGFECGRFVFNASLYCNISNDKIDNSSSGHQDDTIIELLKGKWVNQVEDGFINNEDARNHDKYSFYCGRQKFGLAMSIRMIFIPGLGRYMQAVHSNDGGNNIYNAFQCVGEDRY